MTRNQFNTVGHIDELFDMSKPSAARAQIDGARNRAWIELLASVRETYPDEGTKERPYKLFVEVHDRYEDDGKYQGHYLAATVQDDATRVIGTGLFRKVQVQQGSESTIYGYVLRSLEREGVVLGASTVRARLYLEYWRSEKRGEEQFPVSVLYVQPLQALVEVRQ